MPNQRMDQFPWAVSWSESPLLSAFLQTDECELRGSNLRGTRPTAICQMRLKIQMRQGDLCHQSPVIRRIVLCVHSRLLCTCNEGSTGLTKKTNDMNVQTC